MTQDVVTVEETTNYKAVAEAMAARKISAVPVVDGAMRVIGVVSEADLLYKVEFEPAEDSGSFVARHRHGVARAKAAGTTAGDVLTKPAVTTTADATVASAARLMDRRRVKRLPVVDEDGRLVGIVSRRDLLRVFLRSDDAIRSEVVEYVLRRLLWVGPPEITVEVSDGVVTLAGQLEQKTLVEIAGRLTGGVPGVVAVVNHLTYRTDDRRLEVPNPLL